MVEIEYSTLAPSAWLEETRSFSGQCGQDSALFSFSGGMRHDLELGDRLGALAERGADAVAARIAAADDDHVLAVGRDLRLVALRLAGDAPVLLRQEVHGEKDAVEVAPRRLCEEVERLLGAAGQQHGVVLGLELACAGRSTPTCTLQWKTTPSASICLTRRSTMRFSILKSGMP